MKHLELDGRNIGITEDGKVFTENDIELSQYTDVYGYKYVSIKTNSKKRKKLLVHRLVAKAYIPTDDDSLQINHKDGDKANNSVENLEWCTNSDNQTHSRYVLGNRTGFEDVAVLCVETKQVYKSTRDAWRNTGISYSHISECANGKRKTAGGYHWERA